jgi:hypothetical protein
MSFQPKAFVVVHQSRERQPQPRGASYAFAWAGLYECHAGAHILEVTPGLHRSMSLVLLRVGREMGVFFKDLAEHASRLLSGSALDRGPGHVVLAGALHHRLVLNADGLQCFPVLLPNAGRYALFTQRHPTEFTMRITGLKLVYERSSMSLPDR